MDNHKHPPGWSEISKALYMVTQSLQAEWQCGLPPFDTLPSSALELIVDEWCARLSDNLSESLSPPELVRPWILARVASMAATAKLLEVQGDTDSPGLSPQTARRFLIDEWHGVLRNRWQMMMTLDLLSPP